MKVLGDAAAKILPIGQKKSHAPESTCPTAQEQKSFFEPFLKNKVPTLLKQPPLSSFKKLIVSTPRLIQGLCEIDWIWQTI
jgi:hypothetical protein